MPAFLLPGLPGAALALAVALGVALAARRLGPPWLAGLAAGAGVLAGWWATLGLLTATPRQLPERLPLLVLVLLLGAAALGPATRRWPRLALPALAAGALWTGWWMAGLPRDLPSLGRAAPVLAGVAAAALALALAARPRWATPVAAAALLAGMVAAPLPGPGAVLGLALLAAALGAAAVPAVAALAPLPAAGAIAALGAIPPIARGAPADWAVAAAPLVALLVGAPLGARLHPRLGGVLGASAGGAVAAVVAFLLR